MPGIRRQPCGCHVQVDEKSLEETVMFTNEDEGFQDLFDRLLAYSSTKQSVKMSENKRQTRRDDPMDVDALSKGRVKGKGKRGPVGSGKGSKGQNHMTDVRCWKCGKLWPLWPRLQRDAGKGKLNSVASSNWQADGWRKTTDEQTGSSSGW